MKKGRFLLTFLLIFGALLVAWSRTDASSWYTSALLHAATFCGALTHGWLLELPADPLQRPVWVRGAARIELKIQFEALAVGVVPMLALLSSTPGVRLVRRLRQMGLGLVMCFAIDLAIIVLFPLLLFYPNDFTDILGTFLGLVGFVGAPVIIWFILAFRDLRQWLPRFQKT